MSKRLNLGQRTGLHGRIFAGVLLVSLAIVALQVFTESGPPIVKESPQENTSSTNDERESSTVSLAPFQKPLPAGQSAIEALAGKYDAGADDWSTEILTDLINRQLSSLASLLQDPTQIRLEDLKSLAADEFVCKSLRPKRLQAVFRDSRMKVFRGDKSIEDDASFAGPSGFGKALKQLTRDLNDVENRRAKFKLIRILESSNGLETQVRFEGNVNTGSTATQQTATWNCRWKSEKDNRPYLETIELADYEETIVTVPGGRLFHDCTKAVLGANPCYSKQVIPGLNHWFTRIPKEFLDQFGHHGLAMGDVNNDGLDDLYVCDAGGLPNRLYVQNADGTAVDISKSAGVDLLDNSISALLIDLDNDGDQDLIVGMDTAIQVGENDGQGRFHLRERISIESDLFSLSAADFDLDGDLDIYACGYDVRKSDPTTRGLPFPFPYHDANNGGRNSLLRNEGALRFSDVTAETGLDENNSRFSMAASWEDFDNDGDLDLYVANDFGRNCLYRNDRGHFRDVAKLARVEDHASGMSVSWGDYNRDGRMDLYVGNMFSAAGNRVTYQRRFSAGVPKPTAARLKRMARGNSLFQNASGTEAIEFQDVSDTAAVTMGRWAWASKFVDLCNDGWPDLIVSNGYLTNENRNDL